MRKQLETTDDNTKEIPIVTSYKYLGCTLQGGRGIDAAINEFGRHTTDLTNKVRNLIGKGNFCYSRLIFIMKILPRVVQLLAASRHTTKKEQADVVRVVAQNVKVILNLPSTMSTEDLWEFLGMDME